MINIVKLCMYVYFYYSMLFCADRSLIYSKIPTADRLLLLKMLLNMFFIISLRSILIKESRTHGTRLGSIINVSVYMLLQLVNLITGKGDLTQRTVELGSSWFSSSTHAVRGWS